MKRVIATAALLALPLAACGEPPHQDILAKAENVSTKSELVDALGDPTKVTKVGPLETWTYEASNGEVTFVITGDNVALKTASGGSDKE